MPDPGSGSGSARSSSLSRRTASARRGTSRSPSADAPYVNYIYIGTDSINLGIYAEWGANILVFDTVGNISIIGEGEYTSTGSFNVYSAMNINSSTKFKSSYLFISLKYF